MELIYKKDAIHAVPHNSGQAAVAAVENIKGIEMPADFMKRDNKTISFTGLLHSLRTNGFCNEQCEDCQESMETAADELEKLLQDYALLSGKYDEVFDKLRAAYEAVHGEYKKQCYAFRFGYLDQTVKLILGITEDNDEQQS